MPARVSHSRCRYPLRRLVRSGPRLPYSAPHGASASALINACTNAVSIDRNRSGSACCSCSNTAGRSLGLGVTVIVDVSTPSLKSPSGEARLRAFFQNWRNWNDAELNGGCVFMAAAVEFDDQPGPVREALVSSEREWLGLLASVTRSVVAKGEFRDDLDVDQFVFEFHGLMLAHHHASRLLLSQAAADERTSVALNRLFADAQSAAVKA